MHFTDRIPVFIALWLTSLTSYSQAETQASLLLDSAQVYLSQFDRPDKTISYATDALYVLPEDDTSYNRLKERAYMFLVLAFEKLERPKDVIINQRKQINLRRQDSARHFHQLQYINYHRMAGAFMRVDGLDSAEHYLRKGIEIIQKTGDSLYIAGSFNNYGIYFQRLGQFQKADSLYDYSLEILPHKRLRDSLLYTSIRDNQAELLLGSRLPVYQQPFPRIYHVGDDSIQMAIDIIAENYRILESAFRRAEMNNEQTELGTRNIRVGLKLASLYILQSRYDQVIELLKELPPYLIETNRRVMFRDMIDIENMWIETARLMNNDQLLYSHLKRKDSILAEEKALLIESQTRVENALTEYAVSKVEQSLFEKNVQLQQAARQASQQRMIYTLVVVIILILLIAFLVYHRKALQTRRIESDLKQKEIENQNLQNERLQLELSQTEQDLSTYLMQVSLKQNWARQLSESLGEAIQNDDVDAERIRKIVLDLRHQSSLHDKIELSQNSVNDVNEQFFSQLKSKYPSLTKSEEEICAYIRLNLNAKEIASIRNIDPLSVRKARQRIRKKMNLNPNEDLHEVLKGV